LAHWSIPDNRANPTWGSGFGCSPAVAGSRVYIASIDARVFCFNVDSIQTAGPVWTTDLFARDMPHKQPLDNSNPPVACWTSPLVVNGKVYVGIGLGENGSKPPFGFIYCLDAGSGQVIWLFCTNKFVDGKDNAPNSVPKSLVGGSLQAPYTALDDPPFGGASVWSSCAYGEYVENGVTVRTVYAGTGNTFSPNNSQSPLPGRPYASGVIGLDADTGTFRGYYPCMPDDAYRPDDSDVDVGASPLVFYLNGLPTPLVAVGNKAGSFFVLDGSNVQLFSGPRQLLPRLGGDGFRQTFGTALSAIDKHDKSTENQEGIYAAAAWSPTSSAGVQALFVPLTGVNYPTSFLRALNAETLVDIWPTEQNSDGVTIYSDTNPPMYSQTDGLGAACDPAVVNDLVFVSPATPVSPSFYALAADTGKQCWADTNFSPVSDQFGPHILGPAISGNFVVVGYRNGLYVYQLIAGWQNWFSVPHGSSGAAQGAPVAAVWAPYKTDHLDLFVTRKDGVVMSNFWDLAPASGLTPGWQNWFAVLHGSSGAAPGAAVAAMWAPYKTDHLDLFVTSTDGVVMSNFWDLTPASGLAPGWQNWFAVPHGSSGAAQGAPVAAVWAPYKTDHLDLFVTSKDGVVMSNFWDLTPASGLTPGWQNWFAVPHGSSGAAQGAPVAAVWAPYKTDHLDLFVTSKDGIVMSNFWDLTPASGLTPGWQNWFAVPPGAPGAPGATAGAAVAAVWAPYKTDHLDLFVTSKDGVVMSNFWDLTPPAGLKSGWQNWFAVGQGSPDAALGAPVTAVWAPYKPNHLDLFVTGRDGIVRSTYWESAIGWKTWFTVEHGSSDAAPGAPVAALWAPSQPDHLDLFVTGGDGAVRSNFWQIP
jgi:hypothetical protein